ncbi:Ig-like domain repeat protein [Paenibacillus sp. MBLB4367]|uniref:Ig-like domain repeat protein n=1 Tax=Paenibacillus sp. MBLB4367 TaxID=3384767 RepID=UPI0039081A5D
MNGKQPLPVAVAVNPATNRIYVANSGTATVTVISGEDNATVQVPVGFNPQAVAVNPITDNIYVANRDSNTVTVIDGRTNSPAAISLKVGTISATGPQALAVNPVTNKIYVADFLSNMVTVIDGETNKAIKHVTVGNRPTAVAVNPETNRIYVANAVGNSVTVLNGADDSVAHAAIPTGTKPSAIAVNPNTNLIYTANFDSGNVTVINGASFHTFTVGSGTNPKAIAVDTGTNKVYISNYGSGNVTQIDGTSESAATTVLKVGPTPFAITVNPVTHKVYTANNGGASVSVIDGADLKMDNIPLRTHPSAVDVDPIANKIYVANKDSDEVTVIDGVYGTTATVQTGKAPSAVAVNPVTGKSYIVNFSGNNVTVIDGETGDATTVEAGINPQAIAVNPVTNKIYVANLFSNDITVIDGDDNSTVTVPAGQAPVAIGVNTATNKIYAANYDSNSVTVIDGGNHHTATVTVGEAPSAIAVNPKNNKIYVANFKSHTVTEIDGAENTTMTVSLGTGLTGGKGPQALAVNSQAGRVYVANVASNNVTVIDVATHQTASVAAGIHPFAVAVNPASNKIYVANYSSGDMTVIDGTTAMTSSPLTQTVPTGSNPQAVAVNAGLSKIYVTNSGSNNITVVSEQAEVSALPEVTVSPLPQHTSDTQTPTFGLLAAGNNVKRIYYQVDSLTGPWLSASPDGASGSGAVPALVSGMHTLYAFATDGMEASSINTGGGNGAKIGKISAYPFLVIPPKSATETAIASSVSSSVYGEAVVFTATVVAKSPGSTMPTGKVTFREGSTELGTAMLAAGVAKLTTSVLEVGEHEITAHYQDGRSFFGSVSLPETVQVGKAKTGIDVQSVTQVAYGTSFTLTASVNVVSPGAGLPAGMVKFESEAGTLGSVPLDASGNARLSIERLSIGTHTITAAYSGDLSFEGSSLGKVVYVYDPLSALLLDETEYTLRVGQTHATIATAVYGSAEQYDVTRQSQYSSSNTAVAIVDEFGVVQAVGAGASDISVRFGDASATVRVVVLSDNAALAAITLSEGSLAFDPNTLSYMLKVGANVRKLKVTAAAANPQATIQIGANLPASGTAMDELILHVGTNVVTITVTAPDGHSVQKYTLTIIRGRDIPGNGGGPDKGAEPGNGNGNNNNNNRNGNGISRGNNNTKPDTAWIMSKKADSRIMKRW